MKCYAIENHPNDSRVTIDPNGIVQTLSSRMGTGGNNTPFVLVSEETTDFFILDSHPTDSRIRIAEGACPTVTAHIAKLSADGPLLLIRRST